MFGVASQQVSQGLLPNSDSTFRMLVYGSIEVYAALVKALVAAFGHAGSLVKQVPELDAAILNVTAATLHKVLEQVTIYKHTLQTEEVMYLLAGW